jgi:hypothetical protein
MHSSIAYSTNSSKVKKKGCRMFAAPAFAEASLAASGYNYPSIYNCCSALRYLYYLINKRAPFSSCCNALMRTT